MNRQRRSSGKNPDPVNAQLDAYQKAWLRKNQVKMLKRKSPNISKLYNIGIPSLRVVYYQKSLRLHRLRLKQLRENYPKLEIIANNYGTKNS